MRALLVALTLLLVPIEGGAVQPDEVLADAMLEARARAITSELRCVVCQSESIDESNAEIARDMRILVRERIVLGDSDAEVIDYLVDRYGEYVLFRPPFTRANAPLWFAAPVLMIAGLGIAAIFIRRHGRTTPPPRVPLNADEQSRLARLMDDGRQT